ncbi:hypothetical protein K402DRAFT_407922 [Aulographum hederae CBS 113979]|uniref:RING-type domain-containing protein n=1 Tax=Aulographum hederae CBS 113979 TaxID=1176131 RepID=A0A6G1GMU9_9PEZI|nr:hypothetical protein K402DRAFT_407922 [Aulographum hederae CBS 113979]
MSGYEVEHGLPTHASTNPTSTRPDMSSFFASLAHSTTSPTASNPHAQPLPRDISASYRLLADTYNHLLTGGDRDPSDDVLEPLIEQLMAISMNPPQEVKGVPDEFVAELDRIPKKVLLREKAAGGKPNPKDSSRDALCPICQNEFLEDEHPLVVVLPCKGKHRFDLECVTPWLKLNRTCPLDREVLWKEKPMAEIPKDEEEEDYDDQIA